jgi:hypothetical protein
MDSASNSIESSISCGSQKKVTHEFNARTTIEEFHACIRNLFGGELPPDYSIMFYDEQKKKLAVLNETELQSTGGPFLLTTWDLLVASQHRVTLFIVDDSSENSTQARMSKSRKHVE